MPIWNLAELMSGITSRAGFRSDLSASVVSFWVNQAYQDVAGAERHAELERIVVSSTTSGENRIDIPADMYELLTLSYLTDRCDGSARTLQRTSEYKVDAQGFLPIAQPTHYVQYGSWLELWPSPDSSYSLQLRYTARPSDMTATTSVPSLSTEWRLAVMHLGEAYIHELIGNAAEGAEARARYAGYSQTLKNTMARRQAATPMSASIPLRRSRY